MLTNKQFDLSVLIPGRNEMFLGRTVESVLKAIKGNTEVIVVLDGSWDDSPILTDPRVTVVYHNKSVGQRAATNEAARLSRAKYIMKLDAHCEVDEGFDVKLMENCEINWTVIPRMYNLHAFDWKCRVCGMRTYQGPTPTKCENPKCASNAQDNPVPFKTSRKMVWKPRLNKRSDFMRFDSNLHFQYWGAFESRPEAQGDIADTMSNLGACWFMWRQRYWDLGGLDEEHGSWGQMGVEISLKTWLSGGRQVVNKKTWFSHMFRTQGGDFGFPYPLSGGEVDRARKHSKELWLGNRWPKAVRGLDWVLEHFYPVPDWHDNNKPAKLTKGVIYYTDNKLDEKIAGAVQRQIKKGIKEKHIVSASLKPIAFGKNITLERERGYLTMAKQILAALETSDADVVFFCEHDVLYHPTHFDFIPPRDDTYYYNTNVWKVRTDDGHALSVDDCKQLSGLCAYRKLLIEHYKKRVSLLEMQLSQPEVHGSISGEESREYRNYVREMGFEPGTHNREARVDDHKADSWKSKYPNIDIRHNENLTPTRWKKEQFRNQKFTKGWMESDEVPGWGVTKGKFSELLSLI